VIAAAVLAAGLSALAASPTPEIAAHGGETVAIPSGGGRALRGLLWLPAGSGPFPAVLFCHGSGTSFPPQRTALGPLFAKHGYAFLFLFRRGAGLSQGAGVSSSELMERELARDGPEARNRLQLRLLETDELDAERAGLAFLRDRSVVDASRIAVVGHSFGGSLALLLAEAEPDVRAVVDFAGSANSWGSSAPLRERLLASAARGGAPVFFAYAENDESTAPAKALAAAMEQRGRPHMVRIYPPLGTTAAEGHDLVYSGVSVWESDVFTFLDGLLRPAGGR
jgi:dienelactone hydrolase